MNDQQLETVLRRTLTQHADTIDSGPTWPLEDDVLAQHSAARKVAWWPIAAAIVAVLAVLGVVVAIRHTTDHGRPAEPVPSPIVRTKACTVPLPGAWKAAIAKGMLSGPDAHDMIMATDKHGSFLLRSETGGLTLIAADGARRTISTPTDQGAPFAGASLDERWIVLPLVGDRLTIELIDRQTWQIHPAASYAVPASSPAPSPVALFDQHIYWVQPAADPGALGADLLDYDIRATTSHIVMHGDAKNMISTPTGVAVIDTDGKIRNVAGTAVPRAIAALHPGVDTLHSDGQNYAWRGPDGSAYWWSTQTRQLVTIRDFSTPAQGAVLDAVAGPYLIFDDLDSGNGASALLDTRTGATASLDRQGAIMNIAEVMNNSSNGQLALASETGGPATTIFSIQGLPELHC